MVTDEVCVIDEEVRSTTAADFATKHCAHLYWKEGEERKLSWPSLARMEPLWISFLHISTCHLFPTEAGPAASYQLMSVAVASSLGRPCPSSRTSDCPRKFSKEKWTQHPNGSGNCPAVHYLKKYALTTNVVSLLSWWRITKFVYYR